MNLFLRTGMAVFVVIVALAPWTGFTANAAQQSLSAAQNEINAVRNIGAIAKRVFDLRLANKYPEALIEAQRYEAAVRQRFGSDSLAHSIALDTLAENYGFNSRHAEAEETYKRALAIQENIIGTDNPQLLDGALSDPRLPQLYYLTQRDA